MDKDLQSPRKLKSHRRKHAPPRAAISFGNRSLLLQICAKIFQISENRSYQEIIWLSIYKIWKFQTQKSFHAPPLATIRSGDHLRTHTRRHRLLWAHTRRLSLTCLHVATRADTRPQHDDVIIHYDLTRLPRPTRFDPFIRTRSKPPRKKKGLTKLNLNFDQKVKIFKMGLSLSVFWVHSNFGIHFLI